MFNFIKATPSESSRSETTNKKNWFNRLSEGLKKTRSQLGDKLTSLILGKKTIDANLFAELETILLTADVGVATTQKILARLTEKVARKELSNPQTLIETLKEELRNQLKPHNKPLPLSEKTPYIILMVGVNGAGKTTSIAKIAHFYKQRGKKVMLAAGDTFRAAAIEQLQVWGERNEVPVVAQQHGADSASVIYDAIQAAMARKADILIADTAGRLHTQQNLMAELQKVKRVMTKLDPSAPHETMLILDASIGQNALNQAEQFHTAIGLTSLAITKLDGSAKGGILFAITEKMQLPIRFIGIGEQIDDLKPFDENEFVEALFS